MTQENKIQVNAFTEGGEDIKILTGKAPDPVNQSSTHFSGRLDAPGNFHDARKDTYEKTDAVVVANYEKRSVELVVHPDYESKKIKIGGVLELDHKLERFGINHADKKYTRDELAQLFKFNRNAFNVVEEGMSFVKKLKDFKIKVDQAFEDKDDQRGGKKMLIERVVSDCNIPETITLHLPIFKGEEKQLIVVDVLFFIDGSGDIRFILESADLAEVIDTESVKLIDKEVERFPGIAIVYK